jgi:hypothetical protein
VRRFTAGRTFVGSDLSSMSRKKEL